MADNQPQIEHPDLPAPEEPAPAPTAAAEPAGYYGGKYTSIADWEQATRHSEQEGARLANRVRDLEAQVVQAQSRVNPGEQREARMDPIQQLSDFGVPVDPVRELVRNELAEFFRPQLAVQQAMADVSARRPDFARFRNDVDVWLAGHPDMQSEYNEAVNSGNPKMARMALDWVFDRFTEDRRQAVTPESSRGAPPADAAIPVSEAKGDRSPGSANRDDEMLQKSIGYLREFRDERPFLQLRLKDVLNGHPDLPQR